MQAGSDLGLARNGRPAWPRSLALIALLLLAGCEKKAVNATIAPGLATQGSTPEAANSYADADLAQLTRELRRWIIKTKQRPASFEAFVAAAKIAVPPAPAGKRFALSKEMRIILVDQ